MIDIDVKSWKPSAMRYSASVSGNDGEEELVIMFSPSQARKGPMMIVAVSVDGGMRTLFDGKSREHWVPDGKATVLVHEKLMQWATGGIKPDADELKVITKKVKQVVFKFASQFLFA